MPKANDTSIYSYDEMPSLLDYLFGSDINNNKKNRSYKIKSIIELLNSVNGKNAIQYQFSDGTNPEIDYLTPGALFTNNNETNVGSFTHLIFNKNTVLPIDISSLFVKLGELENIVLKLENPENPNNFFNLKVISFQDLGDFFVFGVEDFNGLYLGEFLNQKIYSLYFNIADNYSKAVYVNALSPTTATIFDTENPPITNNNTLKENSRFFYVGTDSSFWSYNPTTDKYTTKEEVIPYDDVNALPGVGEIGILYFMLDTHKIFVWDGVDYIAKNPYQTDYAKAVYVNALSPTTATIFDTENPPVTNYDYLKNDVANIYIGTDSSYWVYKTSPAGYTTAPEEVGSSNFTIAGTPLDSGNSKTVNIKRIGRVGGANGVDPDDFVTKAQHDLKEDALNKATTMTGNTTSNVVFLTAKAIYDWGVSLFKTWILGINPITGITYTIGANDYKTIGVFSNSNPVAFTVPTDAAIAIPIGMSFGYTVQGVGTVTVVGVGITFIKTNLIFATGNTFYLTKVASNTWKVEGTSLGSETYISFSHSKYWGLVNPNWYVNGGTATTQIVTDSGTQNLVTALSAIVVGNDVCVAPFNMKLATISCAMRGASPVIIGVVKGVPGLLSILTSVVSLYEGTTFSNATSKVFDMDLNTQPIINKGECVRISQRQNITSAANSSDTFTLTFIKI